MDGAVVASRTDLISQLFTAVTEGNLHRTEKILSDDFPLQIFKNLSSTLLHQAANNQHSKVLKYLVESGAFIDSINAQQMTPLHVSAHRGDATSLIMLLQYNADVNAVDYDNRAPLYYAAYDGHLKCLEAILQYEGLNISIARNGGWSALHETARFGHLSCLKALIRAGANVNLKTEDAWWTPGHMSASCGNLDCLKVLIENGIDVNAGAGPNHTSTLLHEAAHAGHHKCIKLLLDSGADPTMFDSQNLPHHLASRSGHAECLDVLLSYFAEHKKFKHLINAFTNVDPVNNALTYHNAFHMSSLHGREDCIKVLIKHGAKHLPNGMRVYPAMLSACKTHIECLKLLLSDIKSRKKSGEKFLEMLSGDNALHYLCMKTYKITEKTMACACILLNSGIIDVNQYDESWDISPCLYLAARNGATGLVQFLLNSGAEPKYCPKLEGRILSTGNVRTCIDLMTEALEEPKSLLLCCRLKIRQLLIVNDIGSIFDLSIPRFLQNYVYHGHYRGVKSCEIDRLKVEE